MDERVRFVARLLGGEKMAVLCREFDISRKTGYKIFQRYKDFGAVGLTDRSRRPYRQANQLPVQIETLIVRLRREHPSWGAPKIREKLRRLHDDVQTPAISTVHAVLDRHGLVPRGRRRRHHQAQGTRLSKPRVPNDLWCADYKGEFMLADRRYCYPLTISDFATRYLLPARPWLPLKKPSPSLSSSVHSRSLGYQRPSAPTTACPSPARMPCSVSKLAVWWLRLGIEIERIKPGHPTQNGRHERIHLTLKKEATKPAAQNLLQQQARFDEFLDCYNRERPHQALDMKYPAELYHPSPRPYRGLSELTYPFHDRTITVTQCGRVCMAPHKITLSTVFAEQKVGVKQVADQVWLVSFMDYDLGFFDEETTRLEPIANPFEAKVLPMCPE